MRRTLARAASAEMSLQATLAPYRASASAIPLPMFGPAPVTSATFPSSDTSNDFPFRALSRQSHAHHNQLFSQISTRARISNGEDPGFGEDSGVYSPPNLPHNPKLPRSFDARPPRGTPASPAARWGSPQRQARPM